MLKEFTKKNRTIIDKNSQCGLVLEKQSVAFPFTSVAAVVCTAQTADMAGRKWLRLAGRSTGTGTGTGGTGCARATGCVGWMQAGWLACCLTASWHCCAIPLPLS